MARSKYSLVTIGCSRHPRNRGSRRPRPPQAERLTLLTRSGRTRLGRRGFHPKPSIAPIFDGTTGEPGPSARLVLMNAPDLASFVFVEIR